MPSLLLMIGKAGDDKENLEFLIANLDGTNLKRVSPVGLTVVGYDIDIQNKKLILLLREGSTKDDEVQPARPFVVDLQKGSEAVPIL